VTDEEKLQKIARRIVLRRRKGSRREGSARPAAVI